MLLLPKGISRPVALLGCEELIECCSPLLNGWSFAAAPGETTVGAAASGALPSPVITVRKTKDGYEIESDWIPEPTKYDDESGIVVAFFAHLIMARVAEDDTLLCLHSGAVAFSGKLLVFPSSSMAGKSTLTTHLAKAGGKVFSDDVLPMRKTTQRGIALGIAPRLRLPLAQAAGAGFLEFVGNRYFLKNKGYAFVKLKKQGQRSSLASLGEEAPIGALVLLERGATVAPALLPESKSEFLKLLLREHFGRNLVVTESVRFLHGIVSAVPCLRLRYQEGEQAVELLREVIGGFEDGSD